MLKTHKTSFGLNQAERGNKYNSLILMMIVKLLLVCHAYAESMVAILTS